MPGLEFAGDLSRRRHETLLQRFPLVDILVNNLGIFEPKPFEDIPDEDWRRFFEVNVLSGVRLSRAYLPGMKERNWGCIVFISSESAINTPAEMIHYGMTKTAQLAVSRGLAQSCAGTAVTVNAVLPGPTRSAGVEEFAGQLSGGKPFAEFEKEFFKTFRPSSLLKRFAMTEEVANLVTYVCSPLSVATNGAALGGWWSGSSVLLMRTATPNPEVTRAFHRGLANEVNGLSFLCPRWKSLKQSMQIGSPYLIRAGSSESAPVLKWPLALHDTARARSATRRGDRRTGCDCPTGLEVAAKTLDLMSFSLYLPVTFSPLRRTVLHCAQ